MDLRDPDVARLAWPATGFAFRFSGASLSLVLEDTPLPDGTEENDWLAISLDGKPLLPLALSTGRREYRIATGLLAGPHEVTVFKRTEAEVGTVGLCAIELDPNASLGPRPKTPPRVIEIAGDSISTGFGILGSSADCPFSSATEDAMQTYGALAARSLNAEVWITAWKGKGVWRNGAPQDTETLPDIYDRLVPSEQGERYVFTTHPDVVVVNLGTNDFGRGAPPLSEFRAAFDRFVSRLRALHPKALLVLAVGPMLFDEGSINFRSLARQAIHDVALERRKSGDANVETLELWTDRQDGVGCLFHPNLKTHARMSGELARLVSARLSWSAPN